MSLLNTCLASGSSPHAQTFLTPDYTSTSTCSADVKHPGSSATDVQNKTIYAHIHYLLEVLGLCSGILFLGLLGFCLLTTAAGCLRSAFTKRRSIPCIRLRSQYSNCTNDDSTSTLSPKKRVVAGTSRQACGSVARRSSVLAGSTSSATGIFSAASAPLPDSVSESASHDSHDALHCNSSLSCKQHEAAAVKVVIKAYDASNSSSSDESESDEIQQLMTLAALPGQQLAEKSCSSRLMPQGKPAQPTQKTFKPRFTNKPSSTPAAPPNGQSRKVTAGQPANTATNLVKSVVTALPSCQTAVPPEKAATDPTNQDPQLAPCPTRALCKVPPGTAPKPAKAQDCTVAYSRLLQHRATAASTEAVPASPTAMMPAPQHAQTTQETLVHELASSYSKALEIQSVPEAVAAAVVVASPADTAADAPAVLHAAATKELALSEALAVKPVPAAEAGASAVASRSAVVDAECAGEEYLCVGCWVNPRTHALVHGTNAHLCLCEGCCSAWDYKSKGCPMCRQAVQYTVQVF